MSCPNNSGNFLMDPLMGGSSSSRDEGYSSNSGVSIHAAAGRGYAVMKVQPSPLSKSRHAPAGSAALSGFQDAPYLSAQASPWSPGTQGSREQQLVAQCLQPCSFPAGNVKEEALCFYQDGSRRKQTAQPATYIRLGDNRCGPEQTTTQARGCFQMSNREEPRQDGQLLGPACSLLHLGTSVESCSERKEEKARSDGCSETSDTEELKGRNMHSQRTLCLCVSVSAILLRNSRVLAFGNSCLVI